MDGGKGACSNTNFIKRNAGAGATVGVTIATDWLLGFSCDEVGVLG